MRNINQLATVGNTRLRLLQLLLFSASLVSCQHPQDHASQLERPAMPLGRIAIVGASVSAGFGGTPFGDAFAAAAPGSAVESEANLLLFKDPIGETQHQLARVTAFRPTVVIALDLLFWDVYHSTDPSWRDRALTAALDGLDRARPAGAWIVLGDVPLITTAAEWMLAKELVPNPAALATINARIAAWATAHDHVILVPLTSWTDPLRSRGTIELPGGELVEASTLVAPDGLHANALGTWYLLDRLDHLIESTLPGTPKDALVFKRPS